MQRTGSDKSRGEWKTIDEVKELGESSKGEQELVGNGEEQMGMEKK